jgi:hypothetical protein
MIKDIIIDDTGDLVFENGDFKIAGSDAQHVILIVNTSPGAWKRYPIVGVGIRNYEASSGRGAELKRLIYTQLQLDGFTEVDVRLINNAGQYDYYINANLNE